MAKKFLSDIELDAGLVDVNGNTGTSGQILSSTGESVDWIDNEVEVAKYFLPKVKSFIDIGCNTGLYCCVANCIIFGGGLTIL